MFALVNHRSAEQAWRRVRRQAAWMAVAAAFSAILFAVYFGVISARYL